VQYVVVEALFRGYFTEGRNISNCQTLLDVVAKAGLDRQGAEAVLNSEDGLEAIKEADALARRFGVDGVPFFIVNGTLTLSGAQQPGAFLEAFRQADGWKSEADSSTQS
jgi:predicted DsbA family dithiol-disulfide isomerase